MDLGALFVVVTLVIGLAGGFALAVAWRGQTKREVPIAGRDFDRLEGQLAVQAAELRRIADASRAGGENDGRLQGEISAARRALAELTLREQERRERETENL